MSDYASVDEYIALFPQDIQSILQETRNTIRQAAPLAQELISWQMPSYRQGTILIHFAAQKKHLGLYPGPEAILVFADQLQDYQTSKGTIRFPFAKPIPYELIAEITRYQVAKVTGQGD